MVYDILYKTLINTKPLLIRFDKIDGFMKVYNGTRNLVLFGPEKYDVIYNSVRYIRSQKIGIIYAIFHNYAIIKVDSYDSLPLEKNFNLNNVIILSIIISSE